MRTGPDVSCVVISLAVAVLDTVALAHFSQMLGHVPASHLTYPSRTQLFLSLLPTEMAESVFYIEILSSNLQNLHFAVEI